MRIQTLLFFIIFLISSCSKDKSLVDNWKSYPIPVNIDSLEKYNRSNDEWMVYTKQNQIRVNPYNTTLIDSTLLASINLKKDGKTDLSYLQTDAGYLIGFFHGEWGGSLEWYSNDGKSHYKISDDEIVQFILRDREIYAIQGLAHLGSSEGSIIKIESHNGKFFANEYLKLPTAPCAISLDNNHNFIVITSQSLLKIDANKRISVLVDTGIWNKRLYPNSLILKDNVAYAGMRAGVYKYTLTTGKQEWLLPY